MFRSIRECIFMILIFPVAMCLFFFFLFCWFGKINVVKLVLVYIVYFQF
uniref:Uncharacterized protein n=1 Tax=Anguilla anguilla TaxID=7936 RepID=A0A0E9W7N9_ANGAN